MFSFHKKCPLGELKSNVAGLFVQKVRIKTEFDWWHDNETNLYL